MGKIRNALKIVRNTYGFIFYISIVRNFPIVIWVHRFFSNVYFDTLSGLFFFPFGLLFFSFLRIRYQLIRPIYNMVVVMIIKDEKKYIKEVIDYYRFTGFDKFYLFDNDSIDGVADAIKEYIDDGFVVYNKIHGKKRQKDVYNVFLNKYGFLTKYAAFFDADEFLKTNNKKALIDIDNLFTKYKSSKIGALGINWIVFGTNGHIEPCDGSVLANYTKSTKIDFYMNENLKFISMPKKTLSIRVPHFPYLLPLYHYVTTGGVVTKIGTAKPVDRGVFLYHYYTKSRKEYFDRVNKGCVFSGAKKKYIEPIDVIDLNCEDNFFMYDLFKDYYEKNN